MTRVNLFISFNWNTEIQTLDWKMTGQHGSNWLPATRMNLVKILSVRHLFLIGFAIHWFGFECPMRLVWVWNVVCLEAMVKIALYITINKCKCSGICIVTIIMPSAMLILQ